jgi:LysM repeat protein
MKNALHPRLFPRAGTLVLSLALAVAILAAALPQPVQAATQATCDKTHVVKEGETTGQIARRYDLKWNEIAKANDLDYPYELEEGQRLCIPGDEEEDTTSSFTFTVETVGGRAFITVNKLSNRTAFMVKAKETGFGVGGWKKLGTLKAGKNEKVSKVFSLPDSLKTPLYVDICLKNVTTDELTCRSTINIR